MAKRFTDSNKWDDDWFLELSLEYKLAWNYICDKCDAVGVWKPSRKAISFHLGVELDLVEFLRICGSKRIYVMPNGNWWIRGFCTFNYGDLTEAEVSPKPSKTSLHYIKLLKNQGLWIGYTEGIHTPKEKEKDKEQEKEKEKAKDKDTPKIDLTDYEKWTRSIEDNADPTWEPMFMNSGIRIPPGKYLGLVQSHLQLLARYPNMRPQSQQAFRHSLLKHISENKDKEVVNGTVSKNGHGGLDAARTDFARRASEKPTGEKI